MAYGKSGSVNSSPNSLEQLLIWLREDLVGELEAINQYQDHIDHIDNVEIKELLSHIRNDEKEHVAEITHAIARIDAIQQEKFASDHTSSPNERVSTDEKAETSLTVGNLFGQK